MFLERSLFMPIKVWRCHVNREIVLKTKFTGTWEIGVIRSPKKSWKRGQPLQLRKQPSTTRGFIIALLQNGEFGAYCTTFSSMLLVSNWDRFECRSNKLSPFDPLSQLSFHRAMRRVGGEGRGEGVSWVFRVLFIIGINSPVQLSRNLYFKYPVSR